LVEEDDPFDLGVETYELEVALQEDAWRYATA
jgi:hypothetical protein